MKVLAISLMRLGDLLALAPVLKAYKEKHSCQISLLIYQEFHVAKQVMSFVDEWIYLDRKGIQNRAKDRAFPLLASMDLLEDCLSRIESTGYDQFICLSHNKVSHSFCEILAEFIPESLGFLHKESSSDPWLKYLNEMASLREGSDFHILDLYRKILKLDTTSPFVSSVEMNYDLPVALPEEAYICIQMTSNEEKKTLSWNDWCNSLLHFRLLDNNTPIYILLGPQELDVLEKVQKLQETESLKNIHPLVCDLRTAMAFIHNASLFVTPDTSLKFLAYGSRAPVIELSLGSSQFRQTGVYSEDALIFHSKQACAPCGHQETCPHSQYLCHQSIAGSFLGFTMYHWMKQNLSVIEIYASEYEDLIEVYKPQVQKNGFWYPELIASTTMPQNIEGVLAQSAWNIILDQQESDDWRNFQKEAVSIKHFIFSHRNFQIDLWRKALENVEASLLGGELQIQECSRSKTSMAPEEADPSVQILDIQKCLERLGRSLACAKVYRRQIESFYQDQEKNEELKVGLAQEVLNHMNHLFRIERKLTEMLRLEVME